MGSLGGEIGGERDPFDFASDLPPGFAALQHKFGEIGSGKTCNFIQYPGDCSMPQEKACIDYQWTKIS